MRGRLPDVTMLWRLVKFGGALVGVAGLIFGWVKLAEVLGPVTMIMYTMFFLVGAAGVPAIVAFMGPSLPGFARKLFGDLNTVLMMLAASIGILTQDDDGTWTLRVGRRDGGELQVYLDGEWRAVGNEKYLSRLGMRPFGTLRAKTSATWKQYREDPSVLTDGGALRERARYEAIPKPQDDDAWLLDYTNVVSRLEGAGGIGPIERAEEQEMRNQADGDSAGMVALALIVAASTLMGAVFGLMLTGGI